MSYEARLKLLFERKKEIQDMERVNDKDKKALSKIRLKVRSQSQLIGKLKKELFEAI